MTTSAWLFVFTAIVGVLVGAIVGVLWGYASGLKAGIYGRHGRLNITDAP